MSPTPSEEFADRTNTRVDATAAFPRVLFITPHAFNKTTGGGITFTNLCRGWPADRIATVHDDPVPVTTDVCARYFRLGPEEIRKWPRRGRPLAGAGGQPAVSPPATAAWLVRIRAALFGDGLPQSGILTGELESWIEHYRPDVIYTILGSIGIMEIIDKTQRRFAVPLVVHMMDDWPSAIYRSGLFAPWQRRRAQRLIARLMERATLCMGICDAMCAAYEKRYGRSFEAYQNTVDVARWSALAASDPKPASPARIVYTGSVLSSAQLDSLCDCCHAIERLRRAGTAVRLDIYSPQFQTEGVRERLLVDEAIGLHDVIEDDEAFFTTLAAADVLLLPVNFDPHSVTMIGLSMPTKVPAYLASGTPVLVYGAAGVAQVEYARSAGWGHVVDRRGVDAVTDGLKHMITDLALRRKLSATARRVAAQGHDSATVRTAFQSALMRAAGGTHPVAVSTDACRY